ncbi:MAG TPA: FkbM family methyltransferase [Lacipirellulaceae bacterium]|nr:FkbM family methyltransferase [Lacipirellulaceae bacterium]
MLGRTPEVSLDYGPTLGNWAHFSEYIHCRKGISEAERNIFTFCKTLSSRPTIAIDVGGNIGQTALTLAAIGYGKIYTFEPIPETFARLMANIKLNPQFSQIVAVDRGIGASPGKFTFIHNPRSPGQSKFSNANNSSGVHAAVITLDAFCEASGIEEVALLKIDVEGFELEVLKGAESLLRRGIIKAIYTEVIALALEQAGASPVQLYEYMAGVGYIPVDARHLPETNVLGADEIADRVDFGRNILWVRVRKA